MTDDFKKDFPGGSVVKNLPASAGDLGLILGLGRFSGEGNGNSFQYSYLGNPMDRRTLWATVHGVTKSQTWLSDWASTYDLKRRGRKETEREVLQVIFLAYMKILCLAFIILASPLVPLNWRSSHGRTSCNFPFKTLYCAVIFLSRVLLQLLTACWPHPI